MKKAHKHCPNCGRPYEWDFDGGTKNVTAHFYTCAICKRTKCWECGGIPSYPYGISERSSSWSNPTFSTSTLIQPQAVRQVCKPCTEQVLADKLEPKKEAGA